MLHNKPHLIFCLSCVLLCMILAFSGCGSSVSYVDGTYHAEFNNFDSEGWKEYIDVTIADGVPVSVVMDAKNESGKLKSADAAYNKKMESFCGTYPSKFYQDLATQFLERQDLEQVDAVAGATYSSDNFRILLTELSLNMSSGNTNDVIVALPEKNA